MEIKKEMAIFVQSKTFLTNRQISFFLFLSSQKNFEKIKINDTILKK